MADQEISLGYLQIEGIDLAITLKITNVSPSKATTVEPAIASPINIQPGLVTQVNITRVVDQKGKEMTSWTVDTDNHAIATAVKNAAGIAITGGTVEGDCNLLINP